MFNGLRLSDDDASRSKKPRRRWGKALGWTMAVLVLLAIASHGLWSTIESHKLDERIARIRAAGEPILTSDLVSADADSPDNAVTDLIAAAQTIDSKDEVWKQFDEYNLG